MADLKNILIKYNLSEEFLTSCNGCVQCEEYCKSIIDIKEWGEGVLDMKVRMNNSSIWHRIFDTENGKVISCFPTIEAQD